MVKEFDKLKNKMDVQITFSKGEKDQLRAKIIFIPNRKDAQYDIMPIEAWGTADEVLNSIRYELDRKADMKGMSEADFDKIDETVNEHDQKIIDETKKVKQKIIEATGVPKDNIIVAKPKDLGKLEESKPNPKQLPKEDMKLRKAMIEDEERAEKALIPENSPLRCKKCKLPKDSVKDEECPYADCPDDKWKGVKLDDAPKEADNHMIEEELRNNPPKVKNITPEEAFGKDEDPAKDYIDEMLDSDMPDWMRAEQERNDQKANNDQINFQF